MAFTYVPMRKSRRMAKWKLGSGKTKFTNNSSLGVLSLSTSSLCFHVLCMVIPNYGYGYFKQVPALTMWNVNEIRFVKKRAQWGNTEGHIAMRSCSRSTGIVTVSTSLQIHEWPHSAHFKLLNL